MDDELVFKKLTIIEEMLPHYSLILLLTPSLTYEAYEQYLSQMIPHNYFQVIIIHKTKVIGLSGYWIATKIYSGRYLEIDNFIILEKYRNQGIGELMVNWMESEGRSQQCKVMMLDAYVENFKAHSFYYRNGFIGRGVHYLKPIK